MIIILNTRVPGTAKIRMPDCVNDKDEAVTLKPQNLLYNNSSMQSGPKKLLYFIKSADSNLSAVETFLNKRNFDVRSETDMKEALSQIIELQPDFVFLAWDHENTRAQQLPGFINQTSAASVVIPFITNNTKEASRKLNICPLNPKLYPPLSGPAIERLVLKFQKGSQDSPLQYIQQVKSKNQNIDELVKIKSLAMARFDSNTTESVEKSDSLGSIESQSSAADFQQSQKNVRRRNSIFKAAQQLKLDNSAIEELKKSFQQQVQEPLENLMQTLSESAEVSTQSQSPDSFINSSGVIIQKGVASSDGFGTILQKDMSDPNGLGTVLQIDDAVNPPLGNVALLEQQSTSGYGALETRPGTDESTAGTGFTDFSAYCMSMISENWCGYLIITTAVKLDFSAIDLIFFDWVRSKFVNLLEFDESDYFEFKSLSADVLARLTEQSDYSESIQIMNQDLRVSFFPVAPEKMQLLLNEEETLIRMPTEDIPAGQELPFSLHLHLPVNQKYLVYTQAHQALTDEQKKRLLNNKVLNLYTPLENEKEYKRFKAEMNVREIYQLLSRKFSVV